MEKFEIYVDGIGFSETYTVEAKDLYKAKSKAKKKAIREFTDSLRCYKAI